MDVECLHTTGQDWANHISQELDSNGMICMAAILDGLPDADILKQSVMDSIALQPVLGCRFDSQQDPPVWVPIGEGVEWFSVRQAEGWTEGIHAFLGEKPGGEQLSVRLIPCEPKTVLCIKVSHAAADGAGAKGYLSLLNRLYNARLAGEKPPECQAQSRGEEQVFRACGIGDFRTLLRREAIPAGPLVTFPYQAVNGQEVRHDWTSVPLAEMKAVPGCTVNDLLLAACARALAAGTEGEQPVALNMTVDLRRYLPEGNAPAICNLSGMEKVCLTVSPGEPYIETAAKAARETLRIKADHPGLNSAASMAYLRMLPYAKAREILRDASRKASNSGLSAPIVSNLGWLYGGEMRFGGIQVTDVLPFTPAMHAPAFMIGMGSYGDHVTLSAGYYAEERSSVDVERFLHRIIEELTGSDR